MKANVRFPSDGFLVATEAATRSSRAYWVCQIVGWSIYFLINIVASVGMRPFSAASVVASVFVSLGGLLLTHGLRHLSQRWGWRDLGIAQLLPRAFAGAVTAAVLLSGGILLLGFVAGYFDLFPELKNEKFNWELGIIIVLVINLTIVFSLWSGIYFGFHFFRRQQREETERWKLEAALASAELGALKAQMNPHFLFNCLNGLRGLVVEDPPRAQNVITRLASILRYSLQSGSTPTVTLERELQTVDDYLDLEAIRFEDRLNVRREIDPATLSAQVPPMIVQTLVENAIKYGVSRYPDAGEIVIASRLQNGEVILSITNNGRIEPNSESTGLGLKNATERLRRLFGNSASISLAQSAQGLVTAMIRVPEQHHQPITSRA